MELSVGVIMFSAIFFLLVGIILMIVAIFRIHGKARTMLGDVPVRKPQFSKGINLQESFDLRPSINRFIPELQLHPENELMKKLLK